MEHLPAKASSTTAEPGIIVPGNQGASEIAPAVPSVEEVQNCHVREADANTLQPRTEQEKRSMRQQWQSTTRRRSVN